MATPRTTPPKDVAAAPAPAKKAPNTRPSTVTRRATRPDLARPAEPVPVGVDPAVLAAAEARATAAEGHAHAAEARSHAAEAHATTALTRVAAAEQAAYEAHKVAQEAAQRAEAASDKLHTLERDLVSANAVIADLRHTAGTHAARAAALQDELGAAQSALSAAQARLAGYRVRCPKCGENMVEEQYEGLAIDRCTGCGGVYFDPGETEQLIQKIMSSQHKPGFWSGLFRKKG